MVSTAELLNLVTQYFTIVFGIFIFLCGLIGNCLSILTFSSVMKTRLFQPTPSRLYLLIAAIANLVYLACIISTRILITGFLIQITNNNMFICKFRNYVAQVSQLTSVFSMIFSAIDQYCVTSRSARIRQLSQLSLAKKISFFFILLWCLINTPAPFLYNLYPKAANTSSTVCTTYSIEWVFYFTYIQGLILLCLLPLSLIVIFGILTRKNIMSVRQNQGSISRQLTRMILLQLMVMTVSFSLNTVQIIYQAVQTNTIRDISRVALDNLIITVGMLINFVNYCSGFYMYAYSSKTLRQNLKNLLLNREQNQSSTMVSVINRNQRVGKTKPNQVQPIRTVND